MTSRTEMAVAGGLIVFGVFQSALAAGAPWGEASRGSPSGPTASDQWRCRRCLRRHGGVCPQREGLSGSGMFTTLALFMSVGALANGASRSSVEKMLWTPITVVTAVLAWRASRK